MQRIFLPLGVDKATVDLPRPTIIISRISGSVSIVAAAAAAAAAAFAGLHHISTSKREESSQFFLNRSGGDL